MKRFVPAVLVIILLVAVFGMPHSTMPMGPNGSMTNCPLMTGQAVVCNMNLLEHIAAWQSMFATTFQQNGSDLFALLLAVLALAVVWAGLLRPKLELEPKLAFSIIARRENHLPPPLLQELFSNGILNSKIF